MAARALLQRVSTPDPLPQLTLISRPLLTMLFLFSQRAAPLAASMLVGAVAFSPKLALAEAPEPHSSHVRPAHATSYVQCHAIPRHAALPCPLPCSAQVGLTPSLLSSPGSPYTTTSTPCP